MIRQGIALGRIDGANGRPLQPRALTGSDFAPSLQVGAERLDVKRAAAANPGRRTPSAFDDAVTQHAWVDTMAAGPLPSPGTLVEWLNTVGPAVRRHTVRLLIQLLRHEGDKVRAAGIVHDLGAVASELLAIRDYASIAAAAEGLAQALGQEPALGASCRAALDRLSESPELAEARLRIGELDDDARSALCRIARAVGATAPDTSMTARLETPLRGPGRRAPQGLREQRDRALEGERRALTELHAVREHLRHIVTIDPLTQALSGKGLRLALDAELRRTRRTGTHPVVMLLDCDNFKQINQQCGHPVGDTVLAEVAGRIRAVLRSSDHIGRIGSNEFLMILPDTGYWEALRIANRLLTRVASPMELGIAPALRVMASVGVCVIPSVATSLEQVTELAHSALAKSRAGKQVVNPSDPAEMTVAEHVADRLLREETYRAVREPIVHLADGRVVGYELLSRTNIAGFEMPGDFLQMAFAHNIVSVVDHLCLKACLAHAASAPDQLLDHHVNLFPSTILNTAPEELSEILSRVRPDKLCIEVTEQQFFGDGRDLKQRLAMLRREGVRVALDDVGFGRTSLELLILLEPDIVKIDRRFVKGVSTDSLQAAAFRRLVEAISALGAVIVAEGIETAEDCCTVQQFGVPYGQGYLWRAGEADVRTTL